MELLIGLRGISTLAGVSRSTVSTWRARFGAKSSTPFPAPVAGSSNQPTFNALEVAQWLVDTSHGFNNDAVADAPFHSALFDQVMAKPKDAAVLLERWDTEQVGKTTLEKRIAQLVEAAFGPGRVLDKVYYRLLVDHLEKLHDNAISVLASALYDIVAAQGSAHPRLRPTIFLWGPESLQVVVNLTCSYQDELPFDLVAQKETREDTLLTAVAWSNLRACNVAVLRECPNHAVMLGVWPTIEATNVGKFFDDLEDRLMDLAPEGAAIIIAPAELLLGKQSQLKKRRKFLANVESGYLAPLRYSARLPRTWAVNRGQRQLAVWIFKRPMLPNQPDFLVTVAELSGLKKSDHPQFVSDIVTVALNADEMTKHAFLNARQVRAAEALRKDRLTLELWTSQTATRPRMLGELLSLADQAGFQIPEEYALEDSGTEEPSLQRYSWKRATQGKDRVVDVLSGARIADLEFGDEGPGTVAVIGLQELSGQVKVGGRRIDRLRLEELNPSSRLTEAGDVVFSKKQHMVAMIDREGGHIVQTPARIARCRTTRGRSHQLLAKVTTPFFVAHAINSAAVTDSASWVVTVVEAKQLKVFNALHQRADQQRSALAKKMAALEVFERKLAVALASDSIRAGPLTHTEQLNK